MHNSTRQPSQRRAAVFSAPETLENRIAPAAVLFPEITNGGKTATWTDVDGDTVSLTITKGTLDAAENFDMEAGHDGGAILQKLNLTAEEFRGTNVTIKAVRGADDAGDNAVNIGFIDATDNTLGAVKISGDLAQISAGKLSLTAKTATAIKSLKVNSMGLMGDATLDQPGDLISSISGNVGSISVAGSIEGASLIVTGSGFGNIGSVKIGGSLIGTDSADSGQIAASGKVGSIAIGGSVQGGNSQHSGMIDVGGDIGSVTIAGSVFGGKSNVPGTDNTGIVRADGKIGSVKIGGSIVGGTQQNSGVLAAGSDIGSVQIAGSIFGGKAGATSGAVTIGGNVKTLAVGGDISGGEAQRSGYVEIAGSVGSFSVKGTVEGGSASQTGFIKLGSDSSDVAANVTIGRDLTGASGDNSGVLASSAAIKKLSVLGSIHGGTGETSGAIKSSAAVAALTVGGNVLGGDLSANASSSLNESGYIEAASVGKLLVSGSLHVGTNYSINPTLELVNNASIRVANNIGSLTVGGSIEGSSDTTILITARGVASVPVNSSKDIAFGSISVGGSVRSAEILAGYSLSDNLSAAAVNPNAQIGAVVVKKDWIASSIVAGAAYNENFGDGNDFKNLGVDTPDIVASIAKITIGGQVIGTADIEIDHFGFVAEQIGKFQIGTQKSGSIPLNTGWSDDNNPELLKYNIGATDDTRIYEFHRNRVV